MHAIDMEKAHREQARWRILRALDAGRPLPVSELILLSVMQDASLQVTPSQLRREIKYLADRKLVIISAMDTPVWSAELTRYGVDVAEYTIDCLPGIARPKRW